MGGGKFTSTDWDTFAKKSVKGKSTKQIYSKSRLHEEFDPLKIVMRESRDSDDNPNSNAVIVALDVTGSMDPILDSLARKGMPTLAGELLDRKPISDPHIMFMGVGDANYDNAPLQCTQFEADIRLAEQMKNIWLEGGGGGNASESYHMPWYFAAMKTSIDCFEKRGKKGYLFTCGDEYTPPPLTKEQIKKFLGDDVQGKISAEELLVMASRTYEIFHIIFEEGWNASRDPKGTKDSWRKLLGERAIPLADHTKLSEVIVSTIQLHEGASKEEVVNSWDGSTAVVVKKAIDGMTEGATAESGVVEL